MRNDNWESISKEVNFHETDCCATCKYGHIWNDEEIECQHFRQEVSFFTICNSFERESEE